MSKQWQNARLADLLNPAAQEETVDPAKEYRLLGVRLDGHGPFLRETVMGTQISAAKLSRVAAGDFIYSRLFACRGAFGVISEDLDGCYVSSEFPIFLPVPGKVDVEFLKYWFRLPSVIARVDEDCSGSTPLTRNRFKENFFLALEIALPPLAEQQRIVIRIEELAAQIHGARTLRDQAADEAEALTKAYLGHLFGDYHKGVVGRLGKTPWARIGDLATDIADGPHATPAYVPDGVPFITVLNITSGRIIFRDHKFITPEDHAQYQRRAKAERGDVLISKDGTIGIPCFVDTDRPFSFFVSVALIKPNRDKLDGEYLTWVIRAPYLQERIVAKSRGDMIRHLVLREIREMTIPVPPIAEQRRIVAELNSLQAIVDELKNVQAESSAALDLLFPSILYRAFRGEL